MVFRVCRRLVLEAVSLTTRGTRAKTLPQNRFPRTRPTGCILGLCPEMNYTPYYTLSEIMVCMLTTQYFAACTEAITWVLHFHVIRIIILQKVRSRGISVRIDEYLHEPCHHSVLRCVDCRVRKAQSSVHLCSGNGETQCQEFEVSRRGDCVPWSISVKSAAAPL